MRKLSLIWLATGGGLFMWFVIKLWQISHNSYLGLNSGAFKMTAIAAGLSLLLIIGAIGLFLKKLWGKIIIVILSIVLLLYILTGGLLDGGILYGINLTGVSVLSVVTIVAIFKKQKE